jgi:hypothetical protein
VCADDRFAYVRRLARQSAKLERERAADAAARAARHDALNSTADQPLSALHARMAALQRRAERRHAAAAALHALLAARVTSTRPESQHDLLRHDLAPALMTAVASVLGTHSALAVIRGTRSVASIAASDWLARAAQDLETVMAEGPAMEVVSTGLPVQAAGTALLNRWPHYGQAVAELGVAAVMAAPLGPPTARLGALCALDRVPVIGEGAALTLRSMSAALTDVLLERAVLSNFTDGLGESDGGEGARLLGAVCSEAEFNQAVGMVSVQCDCDLDTAADLLAARAFADGVSVAQIAAHVIRGEIALADS